MKCTECHTDHSKLVSSPHLDFGLLVAALYDYWNKQKATSRTYEPAKKDLEILHWDPT